MITVNNQPVYRTTDGQSFTVRSEAEKHELKLTLNREIADNASHKSDTICYIINNRQALMTMLNCICGTEEVAE